VYLVLIIAGLLGVFVARGYPPVLAVVVGLILAGSVGLGHYLAGKLGGDARGMGKATHAPEEQAPQDTYYRHLFTRWVRWAPLFFLLCGLAMIAALFAAFATTDLPLGIVVAVCVIIAGWAISGAYLAKSISRRLTRDT